MKSWVILKGCRGQKKPRQNEQNFEDFSPYFDQYERAFALVTATVSPTARRAFEMRVFGRKWRSAVRTFFKNGEPVDARALFATFGDHLDMFHVSILADWKAPQTDPIYSGSTRETDFELGSVAIGFSLIIQPLCRAVIAC